MRFLILILLFSAAVYSQSAMNPVAPSTPPDPGSDTPPIEPGVPLELARWRAAHYSDVRYKLNLTLEKMSPVLKGTIEIRVKVGAGTLLSPSPQHGETPPVILDWRKIKGHEEKSTIANVSLNGKPASFPPGTADGDRSVPAPFEETTEHLVFRDGVVAGENVIKLDFTSPILTSGSAITRYVDKEDGSEYLYSLFVPSDASTAFPVFDQPDLKARFKLTLNTTDEWPISNGKVTSSSKVGRYSTNFEETVPISTYVFAFATGPFVNFDGVYVRKSQAEKYKPHDAEVRRLNREAVKYFEEYFDYKFPFPKYDLVLIPEFPFGGMEHAGATFLREASIIFPQEPTKNDLVSRATLIFHETAHQWFGDTVTMRWFDDLWLKEGFATFMGFKALEKVMPEMNAWKVFYERIKQGAYQTDSTKGTTAIYQPIANLSAAKSAYGNIVYNKAPAFLRQAEFYLGEDKFQTAVRSFLKKHEFGNAGWEDLVEEFEAAGKQDLQSWAKSWVVEPGAATIRIQRNERNGILSGYEFTQFAAKIGRNGWPIKFNLLARSRNGLEQTYSELFDSTTTAVSVGGPASIIAKTITGSGNVDLLFPNSQDYGYGIFLLDDKSRDYVLKNIQNEKDPFLRSMMWGALWDSVREGELDPREYVELVVRVLSTGFSRQPPKGGTQNVEDESTVALLLNRVGTAMNYYIDAERVSSPHVSKGSTLSTGRVEPSLTVGLQTRVEDLLIERMHSAQTLGQRITYYRAFLNIAGSKNASEFLKAMLKTSLERNRGVEPKPFPRGLYSSEDVNRILRFEEMIRKLPLRTKDKFDIVTRLLILGDPDAPKLLADLEKSETSDDAKRYAYAAKAGIPTAENKAKYWNDFVNNKEISESWIEAAFGPWNSIRHSDLTLPYLQKALQELPNHKRNRKIFFVNGWLGAFIGGQRSEEALAIVNKFLADNPKLDNDLRLKILENVDLIERAVKIKKQIQKLATNFTNGYSDYKLGRVKIPSVKIRNKYRN